MHRIAIVFMIVSGALLSFNFIYLIYSFHFTSFTLILFENYRELSGTYSRSGS